MAEASNEKIYPVDDFSGGMQARTSRFQKAANQVELAQNATFVEIGGIGKKLGYAQKESDLTSTTSTSTSSSTTTTSTSSSSSSSTSTSTTA